MQSWIFSLVENLASLTKYLVKILLYLLLAQVISPLGARLGEGLLLGLGPVLVEPPLALLTDMLGPDSLQGSQASWSLDIANNSNSHHGGSLDDGDTLHYLLLVDLESGLSSVDLLDNVGHAGLLPHEVGQVDRIGRIILRESL